jgi:hypothetical protein
MKRHLFHYAALASVLLCTVCQAQTAPSLSIADLYKNFAGSWTGMCCDFSGSKFPPTPVRLVVTIEKSGRAMRWETTYGVRGQSTYDHATKVVVLNPAKNEISYDAMLFRSPDLADFAQKGFGSFSASALEPESRQVRRGTFELSPSTLTVRWETAPNGQHYKLEGLFSYRRDTTADSAKP